MGSSQNISVANTVLNTMVAESLDWMAGAIAEEKKGTKDLNAAVFAVLKRVIKDIRPVVFNGDNYSAEWHAEAGKRGLSNDKDTPSALKHFVSPKTRKLFSKQKVLSETELESRHHIWLERYAKTVDIEAGVMVEMVRTGVIPAVVEQLGRYASTLGALQGVKGLEPAAISAVQDVTAPLGSGLASLRTNLRKLEDAYHAAHEVEDVEKHAEAYCHKVLPAMRAVRNRAVAF